VPAAPTAADLRTALGWHAEPRDVVRVSGPDAIGYLQGQLSQEIEALAVGATTRSFVLQPTGKVDAWVRVTRIANDAVVLDVEGGTGEPLSTRLRRFLLRTKADIDQLEWRCVALRGPGAAAHTGHTDAETPGDGGLVVPAGWPGVEGVDLIGPSAVAPAGVPEVDAVVYEALRIRCGVPRMGAELTERTIPTEAGQWVIDASVSFTKGCFTGQELVARIDSRGGHVPRHLRGVVVVGEDMPPTGSPLVADGSEVGTLTSVAPAGDPGAVAGAVALAYVGRGLTPPAAAEVQIGERRVPATVVDLPIE
jgi:folate-binding protein YgfZ